MPRLNLNRNSALLAAALLVGVQVPSTIERIADPTIKALVQLLAVLVLILAAMKIDTRRGFSDYPPARKDGPPIPDIELASFPPNWKKKP